MSNSPNLDIAYIQAAQAQKEVTANAAFTILDAYAGVTSVAIANGSNLLTETECDAGILILTGALTAAASVTIPSTLLKRTWVINLTTGGYAVTALNSGYTGIACPPNALTVVYPGVVAGTGAGQNTQLASINMAGGANVTATNLQAAARIMQLSGAITANVELIVPAAVAEWTVFNGTSGAYTVTVVPVGGSGITIAQGKRAILYCDGTNVVRVTADT